MIYNYIWWSPMKSRSIWDCWKAPCFRSILKRITTTWSACRTTSTILEILSPISHRASWPRDLCCQSFLFFLDFNLMIFDVYCRSLRCTIKTKRIELQSVSMVEPKQRSPYWVKGAAGLRVCITISNHGKFYSQKMSTIIGKIWIIYVAIHEDNT